jgi:hypothetical protein
LLCSSCAGAIVRALESSNRGALARLRRSGSSTASSMSTTAIAAATAVPVGRR